MISEHLNISARDSCSAGSLTGIGKSRLARDEHSFLSQYKNNGKPPISTCACVSIPECAKLSVHRVQAVIFLTGGGFQPNAYLFRKCLSSGKAALHRDACKRKSLFHGYEVKND